MPLGWCIEAMQRSLERVRGIGWDDVVGQYAAVSETLFWIDIVETQLRVKYSRHYNDALDDQPHDLRPVVRGLLWVRNRITHEVDEIGYLLATPKSAESFAADWRWRSLPPRPKGRFADPAGQAAYESSLVGKDVVAVLLEVTVCLGQARGRAWMAYDDEHPPQG